MIERSFETHSPLRSWFRRRRLLPRAAMMRVVVMVVQNRMPLRRRVLKTSQEFRVLNVVTATPLPSPTVRIGIRKLNKAGMSRRQTSPVLDDEEESFTLVRRHSRHPHTRGPPLRQRRAHRSSSSKTVALLVPGLRKLPSSK